MKHFENSMGIPSLGFDSLGEAAHYAQHTPRFTKSVKRRNKYEKITRDSSDKDEGPQWTGGMGLDECLDKIQKGYVWQEGLGLMKTAMEVTDQLAAQCLKPQVIRHVEGGAVCAGAAVMGHPKSMFKRIPANRPDKPVLRVGVPLGIAFVVSPERRANFGAALMSAINVLEQQNYRCELVALWRGGYSNSVDDWHNWVNIEVTVKKPSERWNPAAMAFAICHAAVQRRMMWRIAETKPSYFKALGHYCDHSPSANYDKSMAGDFDIYFGNMGVEMNDECRTAESAFDMVQRTLQKQLNKLSEDYL